MNRALRLLLLRWHRRLGVGIAVVLVMLVVTGIILNHSSELQLDQSGAHLRWCGMHLTHRQPPGDGLEMKAVDGETLRTVDLELISWGLPV